MRPALSAAVVAAIVVVGLAAPMLAARFPDASPAAIQAARAYAYGGCVIQDLGYYPFGSKFFSNLLHYVRTGDFIAALIADAEDVNEYAFALGGISHVHRLPGEQAAAPARVINLSQLLGLEPIR